MLSIVIPIKHERFLEKTISNIKQNQDNINELILIFDEDDPSEYFVDYPKDKLKVIVNMPRKGTSQSRDIGTISASYDCILQIDAHIIFSKPGFDTYFLNQHKKYPNDILCCRCVAVDALFRKELSSPVYHGADVKIKNGSLKTGGRILDMQWIDYKEGMNDEVPMVMGASYIYSKKRYTNILKRPLSIGSGYGRDEIKLSLSNWICGGKSRVIDYEVYHNINEIKLSTKYTCWDRWDSNFNSLSVINLFPISKKLKTDLTEYIKLNYAQWSDSTETENFNDIINKIKSNTKIKKLHKYYSSFNKNIDQFINEFSLSNNVTEQLSYSSCQNTREKMPQAPYKDIHSLRNANLYKEVNYFDREYVVISLFRSGSSMLTNWIYSQLNGEVFYLNTINHPRYRVDHKRLLKKIKWDHNLKYPPINTSDKKFLLYKLQHIDIQDKELKHFFLPFIHTYDFKKSITLIRSPENYLSSFIQQQINISKNSNSLHPSFNYEPYREIALWVDHAEKCINLNKSDNVFIYYDKFVSDVDYRNHLFNKLELHNRTDKSLDICNNYGGGSSFDLLKYNNENAANMDVLNRWKNFEFEPWMEYLKNREDIKDIIKEIEDLTIY